MSFNATTLPVPFYNHANQRAVINTGTRTPIAFRPLGRGISAGGTPQVHAPAIHNGDARKPSFNPRAVNFGA